MSNQEATENQNKVVRKSGRVALESDGITWQATEEGVTFATGAERSYVEKQYEERAGLIDKTVTKQGTSVS